MLLIRSFLSMQCFTGAQQAQIEIWEIWALVGNDFMTDDTYVVCIYSLVNYRSHHDLYFIIIIPTI